MSRFVSSIAGSLALVLSVGACEASSSGAPRSDSTEPGAPAAAAQATPLTASGAAEPLPLAVDSDGIPSDARSEWVAENGAKVFGVGGDDNVAGNSLDAYIAFPTGSGGDWVIYELGKIIAYTVLSSSAGRVDLDIEEITSINEETSELLSGHRKAIVSWTPGADGAAPTNVTITPAQ